MKKRLGVIIIAIVMIIIQLAGISGKMPIIQAKDKRPRILLDSYKIIEGQLTPGGTVKMKFTFKNTSIDIPANNLLITYSESSNNIYPDEGEANQFYIDEIAPVAYESVEIQMKVADNIVVEQNNKESIQNVEKSIMAKVEFNINYLYDQGKTSHEASNNTFIVLPITQECVLDVKSLAVAETAVIDSKSLVSVVCVNGGSTPVSNVVMHIDGNILEEQKTVEIGSISINSQQALDYYVNMQKEGKQKLEIYFTYEDERGVKFKSVKKEYDIYVTGNETIIPTDMEDSAQQQPKGDTSDGFMLSLSNICILGAAVIALILVIMVIVKKKYKNEK